MIHRRTHPDLDVPGCFGCRVSSVRVAPAAVGSAEARSLNGMAARWDRDMAAYKTLKAQGIQPERIDGVADLAARAETKLEIETAGAIRRVPSELELV